MSNKRNSISSSGIGILGVVQIVFITLKLIGVIDWSCPIVLVPLWISLGILAIWLIILLICALLGRRH